MPPSRAQPNRAYLWSVLGALAVQFVCVSVTLPITQLLTQAPLFYIDSPFHWYEIELAKSLAGTWQAVGYDPFFAAGYIGGVTFNASAKFPALLCVVFSPRLNDIVTYKLYVFAAGLLGPVCVPLAARWLRLSAGATLAATALGILAWWITALRWFDTAGLVSFVFACYLALPFAALVIRYLAERASWRVFLSLVVFGEAGFFLHPLFPLLVAPLIVALTVARWRDIEFPRLLMGFAALPVLCLLPNLLWIVPMLSHPSFAGDVSGYQKTIDISIVWNEALGRITSDARGSRLNMVLWFGVLWAIAAPAEPRLKRMAIAVTLASAALILIAAVGAALPVIGRLQPNRLSASAYLDLSIPASLGIVAAVENLLALGWRRIAALGSVVVFITASGFFTRELWRELSFADIPHHGAQPPETRGVGKLSAWILDWLKNKTSADARVLFEASKGRIHDEAHMAGYYALTSDREFIGGPYPYMHFAGFWDGFLFGRPIESFSSAEFADYLDLYNIGWILVFSDEAKQFLDRQPELTPLDGFGPFQTYAAKGPRSFFLEGSGKVTARSFNRVELDQLSGSSVVLKYHFEPGLTAVPFAQIEPAQMLDDPVPFIRIVAPPSHLVLKLR